MTRKRNMQMTNPRCTHLQRHQPKPDTNQVQIDQPQEEKDDRQHRNRARCPMDKHKIHKEEPQPHLENNAHEHKHKSQLLPQPPNPRTSGPLLYNHTLRHNQNSQSHRPPYFQPQQDMSFNSYNTLLRPPRELPTDNHAQDSPKTQLLQHSLKADNHNNHIPRAYDKS
jgi:hypothetical protein